jgi:hypothetical protein
VLQGLVLSIPTCYEINRAPKHFGELSVQEWWEQKIILKENLQPTRGQIIKWTANKDGGAHYDPNQPQSFTEAKKLLKYHKISDGSAQDNLAQRLIGHFTYEVLHTFGGSNVFDDFIV